MNESHPELQGHPDLGRVGSVALRAAFEVADALGVHGRDCVCPSCASRLPGLLRRLAAGLGDGPATP